MSDPRVFCASWFRPVIVVTVLVVVGALSWTILDRCRPGARAARGAAPEARALPAATAPPIAAGQRPPHPDFGHCTRCHTVVPSAGAGATPVATAPPIAADAKLAHPDWGPCKKCHQVTGPAAGATAVAFRPTAASLLGLRLDTLSAKQADLLEMEGVKGPLVTQVIDGSPAAGAGLKANDAILKVNDAAVTSAAEVRQALRAVPPGGKVKLQIQRGERKKNVFVRMPEVAPELAAAVTAPAAPPASPVPAPVPGRVAIAATAPDLRAQVAPIFSGAPYFLVRSAAGWVALENPGAASLGRGQTAAGLLIGQGVAVLIAGNVGPGAFDTLRRGGIQVYSGAFGSIDRVYRSFLAGALVPATSTIVRPGAPRAPTGAVAVAAMGPGLGFAVAPTLGGSPYVVLYDVGTGRVQAIANPSAGRAEGDVPVAQLLVDRGAGAVIAGAIAPAGLAALRQLQVMAFAGVSGTVSDAISLYLQGRLRAATVAAAPPAGPATLNRGAAAFPPGVAWPPG
jgi:predicted Fe-Mo cluster-binding NifX family protein